MLFLTFPFEAWCWCWFSEASICRTRSSGGCRSCCHSCIASSPRSSRPLPTQSTQKHDELLQAVGAQFLELQTIRRLPSSFVAKIFRQELCDSILLQAPQLQDLLSHQILPTLLRLACSLCFGSSRNSLILSFYFGLQESISSLVGTKWRFPTKEHIGIGLGSLLFGVECSQRNGWTGSQFDPRGPFVIDEVHTLIFRFSPTLGAQNEAFLVFLVLFVVAGNENRRLLNLSRLCITKLCVRRSSCPPLRNLGLFVFATSYFRSHARQDLQVFAFQVINEVNLACPFRLRLAHCGGSLVLFVKSVGCRSSSLWIVLRIADARRISLGKHSS
mmetsp:Transcript_91981/g.201595  ORF Transcript_91981/g.201595 Transcript_91981/m.201595 type:complete len:330 (-) Transcript_91981:179-1168(-)